ncbi:MAG TPA: hypothetical protein ENK55_01690 [Actinobacteria bacterium]|nr:hypothetical protein [Actinomycetota bacterium]
MKKILVLAALVAVAATACKIDARLNLDVAEDGSGTIVTEFGVDEELKALIEQSGEDVQFGNEFGLPEGAETFERTEGEFTYYGAKVPFENPEEAVEILTNTGEGGAAFEDLQLTASDGSVEFRARAVAETPDLGGDELPFDPSVLTDDFLSVKFVLRLPGKVVEHNADEVLPDGRLVWELPITGGEKELLARSETGGGFPTALLILGLLVVAAIVVGLVVVARRRGEADRALDAAAASVSEAPSTSPEEGAGDDA